MNIKFENIFFFVVMLADLTRTATFLNSKCPTLKLVNGRTRYGWRGRSVRFNCMRGFQLVGVKYMTCMNEKWDTDAPICVKYGCSAPSTTHVNGQFIESYRGAVVRIVCNAGYTLIGSPSVYCNGIRWNETFPVCRVKNLNPALSCDFESPDLCGWSQDPMHDFDWRRENGTTPAGDVRVGPPFDHTKGTNATGHYMSMERSRARMENETARLYSPVYLPEHSNGTCFKFWYYVHGAVTGFLKVFVKPEGVELYNLIPAFWINGEQGDMWKESRFSIEPMETPFQIVIEGVKGSGVVGDMAFDDVALTSGTECKILEEMTSSTEISTSVTSDEDYNDIPTCRNRCNEGKGNGIGRGYDRCSCQETCEGEGNCCPDYSAFCTVYVSSSSTTAQTEMKMSSVNFSSPVTVSSPVEPQEKLPPNPPTKSTPKPPTPIHYNNESNEIPQEPLIPSRGVTPKETPKRQQSPAPTDWNSTIPARNDKEVKTSTPKTMKAPLTPKETPKRQQQITPTKMNSTRNETETKTSIPKPGKGVEKKAEKSGAKVQGRNETTAKGAPREEPPPKVEENPEVKKTTVAVTTTTGKVVKNSKEKFQKTFLEKSSSPNLGNEFRFLKKPKEAAGKEPLAVVKVNKNEEKSGGTVRGIVEVGSAALAILIIIVFGVIWYKRSEYRKTERDNMVEDSDSIVYKMDERSVGSEFHSLVCIRPGGLQSAL